MDYIDYVFHINIFAIISAILLLRFIKDKMLHENFVYHLMYIEIATLIINLNTVIKVVTL